MLDQLWNLFSGEPSALAQQLNERIGAHALSVSQLHTAAQSTLFSWLQVAFPSLFGAADKASRAAELASWALSDQASIAEKEEVLAQLQETAASLESQMWFERVLLMVAGLPVLLCVVWRMCRAFRRRAAPTGQDPRNNSLPEASEGAHCLSAPTAEDTTQPEGTVQPTAEDTAQPEKVVLPESAEGHPEESRETEAETEAEVKTEAETEAEVKLKIF